MKTFSLFIMAFYSVSTQAVCYSNSYDFGGLNTLFPDRVISAIVSEESNLRQGEKKIRLQTRFLFKDKIRVGEITAICRADGNTSDYQTCDAEDFNYKFTWHKNYSNKEARNINLPRDAKLKETTKGAEPGSTIIVPFESRSFSLKRKSTDCPPHYFERAHITSTSRMWNELILASIRKDFARPTVTARNLFHLSAALWDAYAIYSNDLKLYYSQEVFAPIQGELSLEEARNKTMSYAAYVFLSERYKNAPGYIWNRRLAIKTDLEDTMKLLGHSLNILDLGGPNDPAYVGMQIAQNILKTQRNDGSREIFDYEPVEGSYKLINPTPLDMRYSGTKGLISIDHWQPLRLARSVDQSGNPRDWQVQPPLTLFWGSLPTFSDLSDAADPSKPGVFFDPGKEIPKFSSDLEKFIESNLQVVDFSSLLSPISGDGSKIIDISPASFGNSRLGENNGTGYKENPVTGRPYTPNLVKHADFGRTLAEFWADGPDSETPPGHWNTVANAMMDHDDFKWEWKGKGPKLSKTEYELKLYLTLNGALHDAALVAWGIKGHYQGNRPISVIRRIAKLAEDDPELAKLITSKSKNIKIITEDSTREGTPLYHLRDSLGKIAIYAWRGEMTRANRSALRACLRNPDSSRCPQDPDQLESWKVNIGGSGWILAENFMPYQRQTFVTPPFPGFISGHSTFSRAAAEVLTGISGSKFFPGGLGTFKAPDLVFESGPTKPYSLEWATYYDAADQSGLSRIYGGIHAYYDDLPARVIGSKIGKRAVKTADQFFN